LQDLTPLRGNQLLTYSGTSKNKVKLPVPLALQKSALRETFVSTIQALKKGLAAQVQAGVKS
jgi:hypothetical protein